ncbi:MAG: ComEC/Rec2 family competence protein [Deltaproteobacteria bacterium]|nr:ComEC/Rec2 family competence protein [Deltaproteobacteria bacterium]
MTPPGPFHAPLLGLAAALAAGCAVTTGSPWAWLAVSAAAAAAGTWLPSRLLTARWAAWLCCLLTAGAGLRTAAEARAERLAAQVAALSSADGARVEGVVRRVLAEWPLPRVEFALRAVHAPGGSTAVDGAAALTLPQGLRPPPEGSVLLVRSMMHRPRVARFPGDLDARALLGSRGVDLQGTATSVDDLAVVADRAGFTGTDDLLARARNATRAAVRTAMPEDAAALVEAFVLGDSPGMDPEVRRPFDEAGAAHLLAVSGLQATLLAAMLFALLRALWGRIPWLLARADPGPAAALLCLPAIYAYALFAGGAASVVRSAWMAAAVMVGQALRRKAATAQVLGVAAIVMLAVEPRVVANAGFLLSFLSVLALVLLTPGVLALLQGTDADRTSWRPWLLAALASSTAAYLATLPLVAHLFGRVATWGALTNVVLVPAGAVALPAVVVGTLAGVALQWDFLLACCGAVSLALHDLCRVAALLPWPVVEVTPPGAGMTALALGGALLLAVGSWRAAVAGALGLLVGVAGLVPAQSPRNELVVMMAPVGQGDGAILRFPDGAVAVIDGGGSFISAVDPGRTVLAPLLDQLGVQQLDLMVLSHPHPDHLNGLVTLAERFRPREFWWTGQQSRHPRFRDLERALDAAGTRRVVFERPAAGPRVVQRTVGGVRVCVLHPFPERDAPDAPHHFPELSDNDNSLVLRFEHAGRAVLFPGDIEKETEAALAADPDVAPLLRADVLKIPHHGSNTSSTDAFLRAVGARHALIGVGAGNTWGFPSGEVLGRMAAHGVDVWRTDLDGLVTVHLGADGVAVEAFAR